MFIWTISDVIGITLFVLFALYFATAHLRIWWQQWRCKHDGAVLETMACDAICDKCGKNLGFIGSAE